MHSTEAAVVGLTLGDDAAIDLHAGDHRQAGFGQIIGAVIASVIGVCQKIVAVIGVDPHQLLRCLFAVGTGGVQMQTALEKTALTRKCCLLFHHHISFIL